MPFIAPFGVSAGTPLEAAGLGALSGLFATCVLSLLIRLTPGMGDLTVNHPRDKLRPGRLGPRALRVWQDQGRSPAAHRQPPEPVGVARLPTTPEAALVTEGPGPEGAAARFAAKVATGIFNRDLLQREKLAGKIVHYSYGTVWGVVYGVVQASMGWPWPYSGVVFGGLVWLVGPAALVPAMKVMLSPRELGWRKSLLVILGHVAYGLVLALAFALLHAGRLQ